LSSLRFPIHCLALFLAMLGTACQRAPDAAAANGASSAVQVEGDSLATVALRIRTASGETRAFTVELAATPDEQQRGLMHRQALRAGHGMLFPFPLPKTASFWMKDTPLPLDLLFVRPDGTIAAILPGRPEDLTPISAGEPVIAVLEIAGGSARTLGIAAGDHVTWGECPARARATGQAWDGRAFCPPAPTSVLPIPPASG
jgi:uncharacterized membrane protein (UPF0127 family)